MANDSNRLTRDELQRYSRQIMLPQLGMEGQQRIKDARVLCVGAGGLGFWDGTSAYYLSNSLTVLIAAVLFSMPLVRNFQRNLIARYPNGVTVTFVVLYAVLLAFCVAGMVNATYSTFLYFQF